jgi:DNA-binding NarL/FixJ family response regulator
MSSNLTSPIQAFQYSEPPPESGQVGGVVKAESSSSRSEVTAQAGRAQVVRLARASAENPVPELTGSELRACCVAADEASERNADLAGTWRALLGGELTIADSFHENGRCYLVLQPRKGGRSTFSARKLDVLEHVLLGGRHKVTTHELKISASTVSMVARQALAFLGLDCPPSKVPLMLCVLAHAARTGAVRRDARLGTVRSRDGELSVLSIARPDLGLHAKLSRGEFAVLSGLVEGKSHQQIATERDASSHTVANQLTSAFRRLGLSGRLELLQALASPIHASRSPEPEPTSSPRAASPITDEDALAVGFEKRRAR